MEVGGGCEDAGAGEQEEVGVECGGWDGGQVVAAASVLAAVAFAVVAAGCEDAWPGCLPGGGEARHFCPSCRGS